MLWQSAPSPVQLCRPFHVCSDSARPPRTASGCSLRSNPVRPYVKTARPPAPVPKESRVLPPWPACSKPDRHRQKYLLWFKVPSAVQVRPAVPLGSNSCLPCPHSCAVCARQSPVRPGAKTAFHARPGPATALPADGWMLLLRSALACIAAAATGSSRPRCPPC